MDDQEDNFAYPYLREGTGVNPAEDDKYFLCSRGHFPVDVTATDEVKQTKDVKSMKGAGQVPAVSAVTEISKDESVDKLKPAAAKALKQEIAKNLAKAAAGHLEVKSFGTGRAAAGKSALDEQGGGKAKRAKVVSHSLNFV